MVVLQIEDTENGWIVDNLGFDSGNPKRSLFETNEGSHFSVKDNPKYFKQRADKVVELLFHVLNILGESYGKHDPYSISIQVKKNTGWCGWGS
jgi:hypothetical protein